MRNAPVFHALLPHHHARSAPAAAVAGWCLLGAVAAALLIALPAGLPRPRASSGLLALGLVGTWRWSWGALHLARGLAYRHLVFPRIRRRAAAAPRPPALYVLVTSYRMAQNLNAAVYGRLFDEVARLGCPAFVVACVTDPADAALIRGRLAARHLPEGTRVEVVAQRGRGKRDAMAQALKLIAAQHPLPGSQVVLMDGDTLLGEDSLARTCAVLACSPTVGAVTTDNAPLVEGNAFTREWYRLRMAHRDSLMASMALSRRILVLTGRFSVFRAELATSPSFINAVERDHVEHGRLGRIGMLTGDDKSTWFEALRRGWEMLYVPDVVVHPVEELPAGGFLGATTALMARWYGNMVRNNGRALRLGPGQIGGFVWLSLLDQRYSMWTALIGPATALILAVTRHPALLGAYLLWVLASRCAVCGLYGIATGRFHPLFVPALYYTQVIGALIKIYAFHNPDRQRWTRQGRGGAGARPRGLGSALSGPLMGTTAGAFGLLALALTGAFAFGDRPRAPGVLGALAAPERPAPILHAHGR